jgi:hypothetical protein
MPSVVLVPSMATEKHNRQVVGHPPKRRRSESAARFGVQLKASHVVKTSRRVVPFVTTSAARYLSGRLFRGGT